MLSTMKIISLLSTILLFVQFSLSRAGQADGRGLQFDEDISHGNGNGNSNGSGPPAWVLEKLPPQALANFKNQNHLKPGASPKLQRIPPGLNKVEIDGIGISLENKDLVSLDIMAQGARFFVDETQTFYLPAVFTSKQDPSIVITKNSNTGKLVSASKQGSTKVVPVVSDDPNSDIYASISPGDVDEEKLSQLTFDDISVPVGRHLRQKSDNGNDTPLLQISGSKNENRRLQGCASFKVIEVGVYADSYFYANAGSNVQAAIDRVYAIVADASLKYQPFCVKVRVSDTVVATTSSKDVMRAKVQGATNSICENGIFDQFRAFISAGSATVNGQVIPAPNGDIAHLFSGRQYNNNGRCIGQGYIASVCMGSGYKTGINEMSSWTSNSVLFAHEAGHNAGAQHTTSGIMGPSLCNGCSFASDSVTAITTFLNGVGVSCVTVEYPDGTTDPPASSCDNPTWSLFGTGVYTCAWLEASGYPAWYCANYPGFQTGCPGTCGLGC